MKKAKLFVAALTASILMSGTAFAGAWQPQGDGQLKYQNDNGDYAVNCWQWIDGNNDGISENYCFDSNGNLLVNCTTPDGYTVDINGAWTVNGVVQTQSSSTAAQPQTSQSNGTASSTAAGISASPYDGYTIVVNTGTKKYHTPGCRAVSNMSQNNTGYCSDAAYLESQGYAPCKICH